MSKPVLTAARPRYDGARGYEVTLDGKVIGRVYRHDRHTYRTTYTGERFGYDRTHTCWDAEPEQSTWARTTCYRTRDEAASALVRLARG